MRHIGARSIGAMAAIVLLTLWVSACPAGVILTDAHGWPDPSDWEGTQFYNGMYCDALVDYAVYKPGTFTRGAVDPTHYVYAYQIVDVIGGPTPSTSYVMRLSVGFDGDEQVANIQYASTGAAGEVLPNRVEFVSDKLAAGWDFEAPAIYADDPQHSPILYYTSPYPPETDGASLSGWLFPLGTHQLPSPTPEPATLVCLALGGAFVLGRRRRRRTK